MRHVVRTLSIVSVGIVLCSSPALARHRHHVAADSPSWGSGSSSLVETARRYMGGNPTGRSSLWCAAFMNFVLKQSGYPTSGSNISTDFAHYGHRVGMQVGAIAVMHRRGGYGHVGVVSAISPRGNPIIISGNHGHRVGEGEYLAGRIIAYVVP